MKKEQLMLLFFMGDHMRFLIIFLTCFWSLHSYAFQVQPMVAELKPSGSNSQQRIRVMNNSNEPLTIELTAFDLEINKAGDEELKLNEEDFLIIPMTTIVQPGKTQSVLVRYIGDPAISVSKSYRIAVDQVPVDINEIKQSGVGMSVSFRTLFNVVPEQATAKLLVKEKQLQQAGVWKILLENEGDKFIRLSQAKWLFKNQEEQLLLEGEELSKALSGKLLLPHSEREVTIKEPAKFSPQNSQLEVLF